MSTFATRSRGSNPVTTTATKDAHPLLSGLSQRRDARRQQN